MLWAESAQHVLHKCVSEQNWIWFLFSGAGSEVAAINATMLWDSSCSVPGLSMPSDILALHWTKWTRFFPKCISSSPGMTRTQQFGFSCRAGWTFCLGWDGLCMFEHHALLCFNWKMWDVSAEYFSIKWEKKNSRFFENKNIVIFGWSSLNCSFGLSFEDVAR